MIYRRSESMTSRLRSLLSRHRLLDREIDHEGKRPGGWSPHVQQLKRLRLAIKDQIAALTHSGRREPA